MHKMSPMFKLGSEYYNTLCRSLITTLYMYICYVIGMDWRSRPIGVAVTYYMHNARILRLLFADRASTARGKWLTTNIYFMSALTADL